MRRILCFMVTLLGGTALLAEEQMAVRSIYYTKGAIYRTQPDGTGSVRVVSNAGAWPGTKITIHAQENMVYWSDTSSSDTLIKRAPINGDGDIEVLVSGDREARRFGLNFSNGDLYWYGPNEPPQSRMMSLRRRDATTGSEVVIVNGLSTSSYRGDIEIDGEANFAYLANGHRVRIDITDQPATAVESLPFGGTTLALDRVRGLLYFAAGGAVGRLDTTTLETETGSFSTQGYSFATGLSGDLAVVPGTDTVYFCGVQGFPEECLIVRASFFNTSTEVLTSQPEFSRPSAFALDVVPSDAGETEPPELTLFSPTSGVTNNRNVSLAGLATDNDVLAKVLWSFNDGDEAQLTVLEDGSFGVSNIQLNPGDNTIRVTAKDLNENETTKSIVVTWVPDRRLSIGDPQSLSEGDTVTVPIRLDSGGDVSGMTFEIGYEARDLSAIAISREPALDGAAFTPNLTTPGLVKVTFAKPGTTILQGEQVLANVTFRARSVPSDLSTALTVTVEEVSDSSGTPILIGNVTSGTELNIAQREFIADINTNGILDVGDASLMQRLLADLDETRAWDETLNDLNGNAMLDSGDVVNVLRTVLGILPQPVAAAPVLAVHSVIVANDAPRASLVVDELTPSPGDTIMVRVLLDDLNADITGVSFYLDYPADTLRLEDSSSHTAGSLIGGGTFAFWNVAPEVTNYENQSGTVSFVVSGSSPWPDSVNGGEVAILTFRVTDAITSQATWPLTLRSVSLPADDGYSIDRPRDATISVIGQPQTFQSWATTQFSAAQLADSNVSGWTADADGDGDSNGQEYFQGSPVLLSDGQTVSGAVYLTTSGEEIPLIKLQRSITHQAVDYQLQQSTNLDQWTEVDSQVYQRTPTSDQATENIYIGPSTPPAPSDRIFLRLVFTNAEAQF